VVEGVRSRETTPSSTLGNGTKTEALLVLAESRGAVGRKACCEEEKERVRERERDRCGESFPSTSVRGRTEVEVRWIRRKEGELETLPDEC
jgi:hypothetical protein